MAYVFPKRLSALCLVGGFLTCTSVLPLKADPFISDRSPGKAPVQTTAGTPINGLETIENGIIKVGVDGRYGGAITYLAPVGGTNMVNNYDLGRQFQIALYGGPNDYSKNGHQAWAGLGWNPVQAGDTYGNKSEVIAFDKQPNQLYVKTIGKQFALNNVAGEATIEHWVRLSGNVVKVHAKISLNRADKRQFDARTQEFPCLYVNGAYNNIYTYQGNNPYSNGGMTKLTPPIEMEYLRPVTEPWMAATNNQGFGVGLYAPNNYQWTKAFFGDDLRGGEFASSAAYVANTRFEVLDHNIVHEWDYELVVGNINDIRNYVYSQPRLSPTIGYRFDNSRKGWYYTKATDTGWPIQNQLQVMVDNTREASIHSPAGFWRGRDNKTLYVRAAFQGQSDRYRLHWRQLNDKEFYGQADRYLDFPIINDGQYRTYAIDLSQKTGWVDQDIIQIALRPRWDGPDVNGWVKLESVSASPDGNPVVTTPPPPVTPPTTPEPPPSGTTPPPTPGTTLQLTAPAYDCGTGELTFKTTGGNGSAIDYKAVGIMDWTTNVNQRIGAGIRQDPSSKPLILMARQNGVAVSYTFDFRASCSGNPTPTPPPTTTVPPPATGTGLQLIAPAYDCGTGAMAFKSTGGNGSTIEYMAVGVMGWTTNPNQSLAAGIRQDPSSKPLTLMARQNGTTVSYTFDFRATCSGSPLPTSPGGVGSGSPGQGDASPPSQQLRMLVPDYNCQTGGLTFRSAGGNGGAVEYMSVGITGWTTNANHAIEAGIRQDAQSKPVTLQARQGSTAVSYSFDFREFCKSGQSRLSSAEEQTLQVKILGNPVADQLVVVVENYTGETLTFSLVNYSGHVFDTRTLRNDDRSGQHVFDIGGRDAGLILLQVSDGVRMTTVKVARQ